MGDRQPTRGDPAKHPGSRQAPHHQAGAFRLSNTTPGALRATDGTGTRKYYIITQIESKSMPTIAQKFANYGPKVANYSSKVRQLRSKSSPIIVQKFGNYGPKVPQLWFKSSPIMVLKFANYGPKVRQL